jgi:intracellular multiplication protein IcmJ
MQQQDDLDAWNGQADGVGKNFQRHARRQQYLSTKKVIWGRDKNSSWAPDCQHEAEAYATIVQRQAGCEYCGFIGFGQELDNLNDNHADNTPDNLAPIDHLCHAWHHLGELEASQALMVYLPGLDPADVVHLQRTIFIALQTGTKEQRDQAKSLLNWMASHNQYVKDVWGSDQPLHFGLAMTANNVDPLDRQYGALHDVALVMNPSSVSEFVSHWAVENHRAVARDEWETRALEVLHATI